VERIGGHEEGAQGQLLGSDAVLQALDFVARLGGHLGIVKRRELARLRELGIELLEMTGALDDLAEALMLATERRQQSRVANGLGIEKIALDLGGAPERVGETVAETQTLALPYFWRKRSTRPAVSISFCLPVKNGWQAAQMSVWISAFVERVWNVLPQAQVTVAVAYVGWISGFMGVSEACSELAGKDTRVRW
jgi:hypothetical protein